VAAGAGTRLEAGIPKAFVALGARTLVALAAERVLASGVVAPHHLVVVVPPGRVAEASHLLSGHAGGGRRPVVVPGGASRQASVRAGIAALPLREEVDVVLVHDAARCLAPPWLVAEVEDAVRGGNPCVVPAVPVHDTVRAVDSRGEAGAVIDRALLRAVQTPQGFERDLLERAHAAAAGGGAAAAATDDATLAELVGARVHLVPGAPEAFKVTRPIDMAVAAALLQGAGAVP
jgi:2-C-methyl-D-erythritol 4-phosphate cytidylyltransferase